MRGLRLGMKVEEVRTVVPKAVGLSSNPQADEAGVAVADLSVIDLSDVPAFKGIDVIALGFLDGRLVSLGAFYDASTPWQSIDDFAAQVSRALALPLDWQRPKNGPAETERVMYCDGFRVITQIEKGGRSLVGLVNIGAEKTIWQRYTAIEEKKRRTFKP